MMYRTLLALSVLVLLAPTMRAQDSRPKKRNFGQAKPIVLNERYEVYGAKLKPLAYASLEEIAKHPTRYAGKKVQIRGKSTSVCPKKGCWMMLKEGKQTVRVRFRDYSFFVPLDGAGRNVAAEGVVQVRIETQAERRHYAEDAGKSKAEIEKIVGDRKIISFLADAVQMGELPKKVKAKAKTKASSRPSKLPSSRPSSRPSKVRGR